MSLLENSSPFEASRLQSLHRRRPKLKRARTPYCGSEERKRRRTSPTGAFSRLSLSPTAARGAAGQDGDEGSPTEAGSKATTSTCCSLAVHRRRSSLPGHPSDAAGPAASCKEARMRTAYSAYEPEPNRIVIESLSDRSSSASLSADESDHPPPDPASSLRLHPLLRRRQLSPNHMLPPAPLFLNSPPRISALPDQPPNLQQLVLYRKPLWPPPFPVDQPQIVQIVPLHSDPEPPTSSSPSDSMDID